MSLSFLQLHHQVVSLVADPKLWLFDIILISSIVILSWSREELPVDTAEDGENGEDDAEDGDDEGAGGEVGAAEGVGHGPDHACRGPDCQEEKYQTRH